MTTLLAPPRTQAPDPIAVDPTAHLVTRHERPATPPAEQVARLRALADDGARLLADAPAEDVVGWAVDHFRDGFVVAASMADSVLADLVSRVQPGTQVLFLDTGYHFAETLGTRDAVAATLPITVRTVTPVLTRREHEDEFGQLYASDPDLCCKMRKVWPLDRVLAGKQAWASGSRRAESASRASLPVVGWDGRRGMVKLNPLATWTDEDVAAYAAEHDVIVNPLRSIGFDSIGCFPCTRAVTDGEDARAGRWAGLAKTECGIHT